MKPVALLILFFCLPHIIPLFLCGAQTDFWEQTSGPQGGDVFSIAIDSTGRILAGTNSGIYARAVFEGTWIGLGLNQHSVLSIVVHPSGTIIAGSSDGVFTSTDQGTNWISSDLAFEASHLVSSADGYLYCLVSDYYPGVYRSTDVGIHWVEVLECNCRALATNSTGEVFSLENDLLRSSDHGNSWESIPLVSIAGIPLTLCTVPTDELYLGSWDGGCPNPVHPCVPNAGLYRSTDRGENWTTVVDHSQVGSVFGTPRGDVLVVSGGGLSRFNPIDSSVTYFDITEVNTAMESVDNILYCGRMGWGVFTRAYRGINWEEMNEGLVSSEVSSMIAIDSVTLLAGSYPRLWRTTDHGDSWSAVLEAYGYGQYNFAETVGSSIFVGAELDLYESTDDGFTWIDKGFSAGGVDWIGAWVYCLIGKGSDTLLSGATRLDLYGATDRGIFLSEDGGGFWRKIGLDGMTPRSLGLDSSGVIIAGTWWNGIYRSIDNGGNWIYSGAGSSSVSSILAPGENVILAATDGGGVFRSTTGGAEWVSSNSGLTSLRLSSLRMNADGEILAGSFDSGVFFSSDTGLSWSQNGSGLTNTSVVSLAIADDGYAYAGTDGSGVFRTTSPTTSVKDPEIATPGEFLLTQNYPNPFNAMTRIGFRITDSGLVTVRAYDLLGREVATIVNEKLGPGTYTRQWDAAGLTSGVYLYRLNVGEFIQSRKLVLIR